jgi:protein LTV1
VLFDDSEYDYMQHLRTVGIQEDGVDSVLIEAPSTSKKIKPKSKDDRYLSLRDLPPEVLPSSIELPRDYEAEEQIPTSISGIQPDMDPHLRQVLEALEDDAFVDDELQDDFFQELMVDGERPPDEQPEFDFADHDEIELKNDGTAVEEEDTWEVRFRRFKQERTTSKSTNDSGSDIDAQSEGEDTVSGLPTPSVIGGRRRRRRKGTSDASGYSMSSSSLYRTEALKNLDEQFDLVSFHYMAPKRMSFHRLSRCC